MTTATDTKKLNSLPFDPLWEKARRMAGADSPVGPVFTALDFAQMVGHNVKAVTRWQAKGQVPWTSADRAAVEMGVHPMAVWGFDWLELHDDYEKIETGALDTVLDKALNRAEAKGEWTDEDGKIHGRGWTYMARVRELEASLIDQIEAEALAVDEEDIFSDLDA